MSAAAVTAQNRPACLLCHEHKATGFSPLHAFASAQCTTCHKGDESATELPQAHAALVAYPGDMEHASEACGNCHAQRVDDVEQSLMNTGKGIVATTRKVFDEPIRPEHHVDFQSLGHSPADSLLRKLCASCHLGHGKTRHALDVMRDRGGGCSACHINDAPQDRHPALTSRVEDGRCFGCHSRSGRIALNYVGLAEVIPAEQDASKSTQILQLADGRSVIERPADIHYEAGMSCIDCHTSTGLMGGIANSQHQQQAVDISCSDCHKNESPRTRPATWPARFNSLKLLLSTTGPVDQPYLMTSRGGTPLWHIEQDNGDNLLLHPKLGGPALAIPAYTMASHPLEKEHERLHCSACHSQWAPQCYGCHIEYNSEGMQKDHLLQKETPGRWNEQRWDVRSDLPTLGVTADNTIKPFVPGMILTIRHPDWKQQKFKRRFASVEPHTTGKSRPCTSCHQSALALGLGEGKLIKADRQWQFIPTHEVREDGLSADAWTALDGLQSGHPTQPGSRPMTTEEMTRVLEAIKPTAR